ncbi:UNVERIFIED_CONTAM: ParB/RepB/Spo0J family partition protein [Kocuria sp. CPCC 205300]
MGEALRNTTLVSRPSDMFFLPSGAPDLDRRTVAPSEAEETSAGPEESAPEASSAAEAGHVSRETREGSGSSDASGNEVPTRSQKEPRAPRGTGGDADVSRETPRSSGTSGNDPHEVPTSSDHDSAAAPGKELETDVLRGTTASGDDLTAVPGATFAELPVVAIHPNRKQPRQVFDEEELAELAYSIGELGVLQPIVVRPSREDGNPSYELVMGERRWRATQRAGLATIPAIVRETADDDLLRDALLENLHRSQLNPLEEAAAYQQLLEEFGTTQEELSRRIGRSRPQISNTIRLLRLPPLVQRRVAVGVLSSGHARALLSLTEPAEMERLAQRIVAEGLSVRATEEAVALADGTERKPRRAKTPTGRHQERLDYIADAFSDRLDTSVKIALGSRKGRMTIEFASVEDLNRIIDVLDPGMEAS